jgi:hypothetical protein
MKIGRVVIWTSRTIKLRTSVGILDLTGWPRLRYFDVYLLLPLLSNGVTPIGLSLQEHPFDIKSNLLILHDLRNCLAAPSVLKVSLGK